MRRPIIAGNWKMYKNCQQTCAFFEIFRPLVEKSKHCEIVICPPFVDISVAVQAVEGTSIEIGGQNVYWAKEGAYTGEVSGDMLQAAGCRWVLVAHSERRQFFGETDATAHKKIVAAIHAGLTPIVCVGEHLAEREAGHTDSVLKAQIEGGIAPLAPEQFAKIVIAYEPVWAIGTGKTATPEIAADAHHTIRQLAADQFGADAANNCRILYGGSVKPDNIAKLMAQQDIDGALVGGASLDAAGFASIVNYQSSQ
ncbi:MAG: triose-phosphate isomerase [Acidobacteriaceae bacterium]|nr:triose-phosphate isomerase [Acidobacteriaceae bacterium]